MAKYKHSARGNSYYSAETGEQEEMTEEEIEEQWAFLDAICDTEVMKYTHQWLVNKDLAPEDMDDFKEALNNIWFNMYGRYGNTPRTVLGMRPMYTSKNFVGHMVIERNESKTQVRLNIFLLVNQGMVLF